MNRASRTTVTIPCPGLAGDDEDCGNTLHLTIDSPEPRTHWYPGSPAAIVDVEGCLVHESLLTQERLWAALKWAEA